MKQPAPRDGALLRLLRARDGLLTEVALTDGTRLAVLNIAWGYDLGDEYAHVTTNVSPFVDGLPADFFSTESVAAVLDSVTGASLLEAAGGERQA